MNIYTDLWLLLTPTFALAFPQLWYFRFYFFLSIISISVAYQILVAYSQYSISASIRMQKLRFVASAVPELLGFPTYEK